MKYTNELGHIVDLHEHVEAQHVETKPDAHNGVKVWDGKLRPQSSKPKQSVKRK